MRKPKIIPISIGSKSIMDIVLDAMIMIIFCIFGAIMALSIGTAIMVTFEFVQKYVL
jgi:hypothetical protein